MLCEDLERGEATVYPFIVQPSTHSLLPFKRRYSEVYIEIFSKNEIIRLFMVSCVVNYRRGLGLHTSSFTSHILSPPWYR